MVTVPSRPEHGVEGWGSGSALGCARARSSDGRLRAERAGHLILTAIASVSGGAASRENHGMESPSTASDAVRADGRQSWRRHGQVERVC